MKRQKELVRTLAVLLVFCLLFSGCVSLLPPLPGPTGPAVTESGLPTTAGLVETETDVPETDAPEPDDGVPVRWRDGGELSFLPHEPVAVPQSSELTYTLTTLDYEGLKARYEALTEKTAVCEDAEALLADYYEILPLTRKLSTMYAICYFRFCRDQDSYYSSKVNIFGSQMSVVKEKEAVLFAAFAASPCREELERRYFGEGFFDDYEEVTAADADYYELLSKAGDYSAWCEEVNEAVFDSTDSFLATHDEIGGYFLKLVAVRRQIAEAKGYETYMDYLYAKGYDRDYTPAQAAEYLTCVKEYLVPLAKDLYEQSPSLYYSEYPSVREKQLMAYLSSAAERMGGPIWEAFRFMEAYALYDIEASPEKYPISYTIYLPDFEAPLIFLYESDYDALCHEFGHFADNYRSYGDNVGNDIAEIYSQAMQYLAAANTTEFNDSRRERSLRVTLKDLLLNSVIYQAALADFELQVYALDPEELTLEAIDEIFARCRRDYDIKDGFSDDLGDKSWFLYTSFYNKAGYNISYSVSAIASLQICRLEAEEAGAGVEAFCRLLDRTHGKKFACVLAEAGLESPFEKGTVEQTADFLRDALGLS